jgi:hypothetical protein
MTLSSITSFSFLLRLKQRNLSPQTYRALSEEARDFGKRYYEFYECLTTRVETNLRMGVIR